MQIGFLTNCLHDQPLERIIEWAGANGFHSLELAAWPRDGKQPDPNLDLQHFDSTHATQLNALAEQHNVSFSCLTYCPNPLHSDPHKRETILQHLRRVIQAAQQLRVGTVSTFVGRNEKLTTRENLDEMERVFGAILEFAAARGVRVAIENCPMVGWQFEGLAGNVAYSPNLWDEMFSRLPHPNFGLNLDPSHLVWLEVDYIAAVREYAPRVFHTHAKDTEIFPEQRARASIIDSGGKRWWRYRLPGMGQIDWARWTDALKEIGYDGALSIEHEDPMWEGSEEKVKRGLMMGKQHLEQYLS